MQSLQYGFRIIQLLITIGVVSIAGLLILTALPVRGNVKVLSVLSGSMVPTIPVGGAVIVRPVEKYATDDVITFEAIGREEQLVTHRIVAVEIKEGKKIYRTKGDANEEIDNWVVTQEQVKGKVSMILPYVGYLATWVKQPVGFVSLIVLPAAVLIYGELMVIKNEMVGWYRRRFLVLGLGLLVVGMGFWPGSWTGQDDGLRVTQAWLVDHEISSGNVVGMATCFENCELTEVSETPTATVTETPTPTPTPTQILQP